MGNIFLNWYREKCKPQWKVAFYATFIIGFLTHIYKFTNTLWNHDCVYNYYGNQDATIYGRWFLSVAAAPGSFFDLPWINGLLSLVYLSLTVVVITELFRLKNKFLIVLCGGLLVTFPSVVTNFYFSYLEDGYMMALFLAALCVYLIRFDVKKKRNLVAGGVLICLVCGIYQADVAFALMLAICYLIQEMLEGKRTLKECLKWIGSRVLVLSAGLAAYYIIWQICLKVGGVTPVSYRGISSVGEDFSLYTILTAFKMIPVYLAKFFIEWEVWEYGFTLYGILNMVFLVLLFITAVTAIRKSGLVKRKGQLVLTLICIPLMPMCIYMWRFTSVYASYHMMMTKSISIIFIFAAILMNRWLKPVWSTRFGMVLVVIVFQYAVLANVGYQLMNDSYERSYAIVSEMSQSIHRVMSEDNDSEVDSIAILGKRDVAFRKGVPQDSTPIVNGLLERDFLNNEARIWAVLDNYFYLDLDIASDEIHKELEDSEEVNDMPVWPDEGSVRIVDDVLVIKINE